MKRLICVMAVVHRWAGGGTSASSPVRNMRAVGGNPFRAMCFACRIAFGSPLTLERSGRTGFPYSLTRFRGEAYSSSHSFLDLSEVLRLSSRIHHCSKSCLHRNAMNEAKMELLLLVVTSVLQKTTREERCRNIR